MAENLTEEQISEYKEAFSLFDKEGDDTITIADLATVFRTLGQSPTQAELEEMIGMVDRKQTGKIEFPDFLMLIANFAKSPETELDMVGCFKVFDREANGFISAAVLRHVLMETGDKFNDEEVDCLIQEADIDGDGHINYEDFVKRMFGKEPI